MFSKYNDIENSYNKKEFSLDIRKDFLKENEVDMEEFDKAGKYISVEVRKYFIGE